MLKSLLELFEGAVGPGPAPGGHSDEHAVQVAAAVLLVEVMRADPEVNHEERLAVARIVQERFSLGEEMAARLVEAAESEARDAYDYHRFTQTINRHFTQPEKIALIEAMWQVAYADDHLDVYETHVISKVAGLLHVTHGEYIAAKLRAKDAAGLAS